MNNQDFDDILSKSRELFLANGYNGTSIRLLSKELGISESELYKIFGGKSGLAKKLVEYEKSLWNAYFEQAKLEAENNPKQQLLNLIDVILRDHLRRGNPKGSLLSNLSCELSASDRDIQSLIAQVYDEIGKGISSLLRDAGLVNDSHNEREIALFVISALEGSALLAKSDNDFWELRNGFNLVKEFINGVCRG